MTKKPLEVTTAIPVLVYNSTISIAKMVHLKSKHPIIQLTLSPLFCEYLAT